MSATNLKTQSNTDWQTSTADENGHPAVTPPILRVGDRLTRDEFEQRYQSMPLHVKAELIQGVVYMPSPVHHSSHGRPHGLVTGWLTVYCSETPGVDLGDNSTLRLGPDSEVQPDAVLFLTEPNGNTRITDDDYLEGSPELVVEVAASSASYDMDQKLQEYQRNGIQEYVVWTIYEERVHWFHLENGTYVPLAPDPDGIIRSRVFPGLYLHIPALLNIDRATVLDTLQHGLASEEHTAFVQRLTSL